MTPTDGRPFNAFTVDVEDWIQSVYDVNLPLTDRFIRNTHRVLALLASCDVRATFFVLGLAAEKAPSLIREIDRAGHEVQSHGYGHRLLTTLSPAQFRDDLERSKRLLEDTVGKPIVGYRAPAFSIVRQTLWALDVLVDCGFRYDSSIFPIPMTRYGIKGSPWYPHRLRAPGGGEIVELPVASWRVFGRRIPVGGGGYVRLFPSTLLRAGVRQLNHQGHAAVMYVHPYEFATRELAELEVPIPLRMRLHQGLGRPGAARKISLLAEFRFGPVAQMLVDPKRLPLFSHTPSTTSVDWITSGGDRDRLRSSESSTKETEAVAVGTSPSLSRSSSP